MIITDEGALRKTLEALDRHAAPLADAGHRLFIMTGLLDGTMNSARGGGNSWYMVLADGRRFYFKGVLSNSPCIEVRHRTQGKVVLTLKTRMDVVKWVSSLQKPVVLKVAA